MPDERILQLLTELEGLGEDPEELGYWRSVLPELAEGAKTELAASLEKELIATKRAAGQSVSAEDQAHMAQDEAVLEEARKQDVEDRVKRIKETIS